MFFFKLHSNKDLPSIVEWIVAQSTLKKLRSVAVCWMCGHYPDTELIC